MTGFGPKAQAFLRDLAANNRKEWFEEHKQDYEAVIRAPALDVIEEVGAWFEAAGLPYVATAKKVGGSLSRIHRDVRFSADKSPYQAHVILHFSHRDATEARPMPAIGIRFDGAEVGMGAGIWSAATPVLNKIRDGIIADPEGWQKVTRGLTLDGERLKTAPRGYDKDHPLVEDLRLKNYLAHVPLAKKDLGALLEAMQSKGKPLFAYADWLAQHL